MSQLQTVPRTAPVFDLSKSEAPLPQLDKQTQRTLAQERIAVSRRTNEGVDKLAPSGDRALIEALNELDSTGPKWRGGLPRADGGSAYPPPSVRDVQSTSSTRSSRLNDRSLSSEKRC